MPQLSEAASPGDSACADVPKSTDSSGKAELSTRQENCAFRKFLSFNLVFLLLSLFLHFCSSSPSSAAPLRQLSSALLPIHSDVHPDHLPDQLFGIVPSSPLPERLVRRLADLEAESGLKRIQTAALYGGIYDYAYYFVSILVGTPPQRQSVIVDSGSSLLGFPCRNCRDCGHAHMDDGFDFAKSTTAKWLSCHDEQCYTGRCGFDETCPYQQSYSEGSSIEGHYFSDMVALGEVSSNNSFVRFDHVGCHEKETNLFTTQKASGIMGVSYPKRGKQETLMDALFRAPGVDTKVFSLCASEEGGQISIGGYNSSNFLTSRTAGAASLRLLALSQALRHDSETRRYLLPVLDSTRRQLLPTPQLPTPLNNQNHLRRLLDESPSPSESNVVSSPAPQTTPVPVAVAWAPVTSSSTYQISVKEIRSIDVAGSTDSEGTSLVSENDIGPCIVDSGTTFSYLAPAAFKAVMDVLNRSCDGSTSSFCVSRARSSSDGLCWKIETPAMFDLLPSFLLKIEGAGVVEWKAQSYLHRRSKTKVWCVAIDDNRHSTTILGMSFMKAKTVIFDRQRDLIGFVDADCPTVSDTSRPPPPTMPPYVPPTEAPITISIDNKPEVIPLSESDFSLVTDPELLNETDTDSSEASLSWASAAVFVGVGVLAMGAITAKTLRGRSQPYVPMGDRQTDLELGSLPASPQVDTPYGRRQLSYIKEEGDDGFDSQRYATIEAELDELERATRA